MATAGPRPRRRTALLPAALAALAVMLVLTACAPGLLSLPISGLAGQPPRQAGPQQRQPRAFATGYRIDDAAILDYFQRRGGERTFGQPVSNVFVLRGFRVQLFQRQVLMINADGAVGEVNLLDDLLPYTHFNGSTLPAADPRLAASAPQPGSPSYARAVVDFVQATAPDIYQGQPVGFAATFFGLVTLADAFPDGGGDVSLLPLLNVEILGLPTSGPAVEPRNHGFVYQRFQRGVLMYDAETGKTQPMLLADYFKALLTGQHLPADLEAEAVGSPYLRQYDPSRPQSLARPDQLPQTDLSGAFNDDDIAPGAVGAALGPPSGNGGGEQTPEPTDSGYIGDPSRCQGDEKVTYVPPDPKIGDQVLVAVTSSKLHEFTELYGTERTTKVRDEPRPGQLGYVWEWTVEPTYNGPQVYTFYIDGTVPCATVSFTVGDPLETSTPTATTEATATKTPKPTKTPTDTRTPTETPTLAAEPNRSQVTLSTRRINGDADDTATVTATLIDKKGQPVVGLFVTIKAAEQHPEALDANVEQFDFFTDSSGAVQASVTAEFCDTHSPPTEEAVTITASFTDDNGQEQQIGSPQTLKVRGDQDICP